MNKFLQILLPVSLLALSGCDQLQTPRDADTTPADQAATDTSSTTPAGAVVATVNGTTITQSVVDVYTTQRRARQPAGEPDNRDDIIEELVNLELMRQEGLSKGLDSRPEIVATINQQHRTILAGAAIKDFMQNNPVSDEQVRQVYDTQIGVPSTEYNARHILVETREAADQVISLLDSGSDFAELAKEKSIGPTGKNGGSLGWFSSNQMVAPFSEAAAALEKGSYSKEPVQTQFGWHVILLEDTRESTPPPFEDVKDRLKNAVTNQQLQQHIQQVRQSAKVEISAE
ncbi:MAG: peptidylprolyl isomerase [Halobacteria archaeon]|nr:peptidylprolyl isomerase [Halobacteria archaeon]